MGGCVVRGLEGYVRLVGDNGCCQRVKMRINPEGAIQERMLFIDCRNECEEKRIRFVLDECFGRVPA